MPRLLFLPIVALVTVAAAPTADRGPYYLAPGAIDLTKVLPPAPQPGDLRDEADRKAYRAMKALIGTPRWQAAIHDVDYGYPAVMQDFSCATGLTLSPESTPAIYRLIQRTAVDTGLPNSKAKTVWQRPRPFLTDNGQICETDRDELVKTYDYPSGHSTLGWTVGLVLAALVPDRTVPILARARAFGESRMVCRVHSMSAVEAARLGATVSMSAIKQTAAYQTDFAAAKAEIAHAAPVSDGGRCAAEAALLGPSVLAGLKE